MRNASLLSRTQYHSREACPRESGERESTKGPTMTKQPALYILASQPNGTLYTGVTTDLVRRVWEHRSSLVEGFTKRYRVHRLVYFEVHNHIEEAIRREKRIKKWRRAWKVDLIEESNPDGTTFGRRSSATRRWIPACAGMTVTYLHLLSSRCRRARAVSMWPTRSSIEQGHGTLRTPSSPRVPSVVESEITGMCPICGVLLPIAPRKASRTPSSSLGVRSKRCAPSSSSSTTPVG